MWNLSKTFGPAGPIMGPNIKAPKRDFSLNLSCVNIAPGKSFKNPNFVNGHHPSVHSQYNTTTFSSSILNFCHPSIDRIEPVKEKFIVENSSQNSVQSAKENTCKSPIRKIPVENSQMCYSRKRCKKNRRNRRKKVPNKNSKQNNSMRQINDMMDIDLEPDISMNNTDSNMANSLNTSSPICLSLTDYIIDISTTPNKHNRSEEDLFTVISISPPIKPHPRERELSVCESEDSFIIFDSGTDEELKFSEDSDDNNESESDDEDEEDDEDESDDSDIDDDFDSSYSVVPCKRVRFAEKEELCEIHPMVQWSFAYRNARKGPWEEYARDRERFNKRIKETEIVLAPIFDRDHREHVYNERFEDSIG